MAYLNDRVFDSGLNILTSETQELWICSSLPTTYAAALSAKIASKVGPTVSAPQDGATSGRRVVVAAISDGVVNPGGGGTSGEAWALVDVTNTRLLAANDVTNDQLLVNGNVFTLTAFSVEMPDVP